MYILEQIFILKIDADIIPVDSCNSKEIRPINGCILECILFLHDSDLYHIVW